MHSDCISIEYCIAMHIAMLYCNAGNNAICIAMHIAMHAAMKYALQCILQFMQQCNIHCNAYCGEQVCCIALFAGWQCREGGLLVFSAGVDKHLFANFSPARNKHFSFSPAGNKHLIFLLLEINILVVEIA